MDTNIKPQPEPEPPEMVLDRKIVAARRHAEEMAEPKTQEQALQRTDEHRP